MGSGQGQYRMAHTWKNPRDPHGAERKKPITLSDASFTKQNEKIEDLKTELKKKDEKIVALERKYSDSIDVLSDFQKRLSKLEKPESK